MSASLTIVLRAVLLGCGLGCALTAGAATMGQLPFIPTRFHLCSIELDDLEGEAREDEMRACLRARFHAEKAIRSLCAQQVKQMRPAPRNSDERYRAQRDCFIQHLSLSYKDLPETEKPSHSSATNRSKAKTPSVATQSPVASSPAAAQTPESKPLEERSPAPSASPTEGAL